MQFEQEAQLTFVREARNISTLHRAFCHQIFIYVTAITPGQHSFLEKGNQRTKIAMLQLA